MSKAIFKAVAPVAEFYFKRAHGEYTVFPAGWATNGSDVFDIVLSATDDFVDSLVVSPLEDVAEAFSRWEASKDLE